MRILTASQKQQFSEYVATAKTSKEDLSFVLDNVGERVELDFSIHSLEALERLFWKFRDKGMPGEFISIDHLAHLLGQYQGECARHLASAKWIQCVDQNSLFGQPCLDEFGNDPWEKIFPVDLSTNMGEIEKTKPYFPGASEHRVLTTALENAIKVAKRSDTKSQKPSLGRIPGTFHDSQCDYLYVQARSGETALSLIKAFGRFYRKSMKEGMQEKAESGMLGGISWQLLTPTGQKFYAASVSGDKEAWLTVLRRFAVAESRITGSVVPWDFVLDDGQRIPLSACACSPVTE